MAFSISELKKNRVNQIDKIRDKAEKANSKGGDFEKDDRFWTPQVDKAGNGYAVIRFLPAPVGEDDPFVKMISYSFKGPSGSWYIENSPLTIGGEDPVADHVKPLWDTDKEAAKKFNKRTSFISNILVIQDDKQPEKEGKVFLFRYGKKIFEMILASLNPTFEDEKPVDPFDAWEGANFRLKIVNKDDYRNYDKSKFGDPSKLAPNDEEIEEIWKQCYSLQELIDPKNFESYDKLKEKFDKVMTVSAGSSSKKSDETKRASSRRQEEETPKRSTSRASDLLDDDDDLNRLKELAAD